MKVKEILHSVDPVLIALSFNELIQGCMKEGKSTYAFFLNIKKANDIEWRDGLWYKMWEMGINDKTRRVISLYILITGALSSWKISLLNIFQLIRGLLKVTLCCLHCFFLHLYQ